MRSKPPSPTAKARARAKQLNRTVRIFLSSTFRDFGEERDLLVRTVFTGLRARLKDRFVELVDVDLRWGITVEQAERGQVLPICLVEIERARPFFVGMLGERYGWVPPADAYAADLIERQPWLDKHRGGKSVTELEILHGVLNNPKMAGRAFFYFRSAAYARNKGGEYLPVSRQDAERQRALKARIRKSRFPVVQYRDPVEFAKRLELDLWTVLDEAFPAGSAPDAFEREASRHEVYAAPRRRLYLGGERYLKALDTALEKGAQRILIKGASGGGKSALIANWLDAHQRAHPKDLVHVHYLGASADAASPHTLLRRLIETIKRSSQSTDEVAGDPQKLIESLPVWLATANAYVGKHKTRWVIVFDALNSLTELQDLRWFPEFLPAHIHLVVSCLPGPVADALSQKGKWKLVLVKPLTVKEKQSLLTTYLARYNKTLPKALLNKILAHTLTSNPLFLRTLGEELRIFGVHEQLEERLDYYLTSQAVGELFGRVLERVEGDCGKRSVKEAVTAIWASRAGLSEEEILGIAKLVPATWAPIRNALDEALLESNGRITFAHDYLRAGVRDRYLATDTLQRKKYRTLARWFATRAADARRAEEEPFQWRQSQDWKALKACLTDRAMFVAIYEYRSNEELLAYWLKLELEGAGEIEQAYSKAWVPWKPKRGANETGELASSIGRFLRYSGRYGEFTEQMTRIALAIAEKAQGPEHPETNMRLSDLAILLQAKGDYVGAELLFDQVLVVAETALGAENPTTVVYLSNLAGIFQVKGDYAGAEPLYRRALAIAEKAQGPEHPHTVKFLVSLARILFLAKADYVVAEPMLRRALAIAERVLGAEHTDTCIYAHTLATLLKLKGDYAAAEPLYRRDLSIVENKLGPEHPETCQSLRGLGGLLFLAGDYATAEPLIRRAITISEKANGSEHSLTGDCLGELGLLLQYKGDYAEAEPLCRRAMEIYEKTLGPEHPNTQTAINNLALVLANKGDYAAAEWLYRRALSFAEKSSRHEASGTASVLNNLASLFYDKGDYASAEPLYRRALAVGEKINGAKHPNVDATKSNLIAVLERLNRKPDETLLLARGDFIVIVAAAKNFALASGQTSLTPILLLAGVVTTFDKNTIWRQTIASLLTENQLTMVITTAERSGIKVGAGTCQAVEAPMPLSDELKRIIAEHMHAPMQKFIDSLLASLESFHP